MKLKCFTELVYADHEIVASYLDDGCDEQALFKAKKENLIYGLVAMNWVAECKIDFTLSYPILLHDKPETQDEFDRIKKVLSQEIEEDE